MKSLLCDGHMNEVYFCSLWGKKPIVLPQSRSWCIITTITVFAYSHYHGLGELSYYGLGILPLSCSQQNALSWSWRIASITVLANCHYHGLGKMPYRGLGEFLANCHYHGLGKMPLSRSWGIATITVLTNCHYHGLGKMPLSRSWRIATITVLANCHYHGLGELPLLCLEQRYSVGQWGAWSSLRAFML